MPISFIKMNGAGNDFVIFDSRKNPIRLTREQVQKIAARDNSITKGCDQVIVMESSKDADVFMRIYNADGGEVDACGNATRCVAELLEKELGRLPVNIQTNAGILQGVKKVKLEDGEHILVNMGKPLLQEKQIPLGVPTNEAIRLIEEFSNLKAPMFISMGNPHVVFFLKFDPKKSGGNISPLSQVDLKNIGFQLEHFKKVFPVGVNVSIAILHYSGNDNKYVIDARVWERGAGLTAACGTAACAMLVAANQLNANIRKAFVCFHPSAQGVSVRISDNGDVLLGGFIETEFTGELEL